jgi:hypothetical protein
MPAAVRGKSAGKLKNGGSARIAVIETAPAIPMTAVAETMARPDNARGISGDDDLRHVVPTCAIIIPTICGALWDLTGKPWTAFVLLCLCAVALAVLGRDQA